MFQIANAMSASTIRKNQPMTCPKKRVPESALILKRPRIVAGAASASAVIATSIASAIHSVTSRIAFHMDPIL